jgi:nicotinamide mononucleotide transporter
MTDLLSSDRIFFTFLDYEMSYVEFFGTLLNLASVWLVVRRNVLTWPVGIIGVVLFAALFYQIELYSDFVEQIYFFVTGFYGWWMWSHRSIADTNNRTATSVRLLTARLRAAVAATIGAGTLALGALMTNIHELFPRFFPTPAALPFLDAFTTVMSFAAQILMAHRRLESWLLWIVVDVIGIWLYYDRDVIFISLLYAVFLVMAVRGLLEWVGASRSAASPMSGISSVAASR